MIANDTARIRKAMGVGLRSPHVCEVLEARPSLGWFEIHTENYLGGGPPLQRLEALRHDYGLSMHGVGLSLGTAGGLDKEHARRCKAVMDRFEPFLVSEHLSFSVADGLYLNDLLPLPYTEESLRIVAENVAAAQDVLGRRLLIENPSRYLAFRHSTVSETEFLAELERRTGCGILLDVNNIFVSCNNLGGNPMDYLDDLRGSSVGELHLAGHARVRRSGVDVLIDDHGAPVCDAVWDIYGAALERFNLVPSLIEWDKNLPAFEIILDESRKAERIVQSWSTQHACAA